LTLYCDESGGIGRGVMTLAAVEIEPEAADQLVNRYRELSGLVGELKGSRIDLTERAVVIDLFEKSGAQATVGVAISALKAAPEEDRGDHDRLTYAQLLDDVIGSMLPEDEARTSVIIDDGRYDALALEPIRAHIAKLLGPCGSATLELSHRSAGLQIADVIANSFFNRAVVSQRQGRMAEIVEPLLKSGQIIMRILEKST
jgi:Protein of unknown function (DUF3800)